MRPPTKSEIVPSSIAEANASISPPEQKNLPLPVITIDLVVESSSKLSIVSDNNFVDSKFNPFLDVSIDNVTKATPLGRCSTVIDMIIRVGIHY